MIETNRIEFKRQLTRDLDIEKEVVAFLNYREGGIIYVGIDDNGKPVENPNIDDDMLALKSRIRMGISPSPMGLFDVTVEHIDGSLQVGSSDASFDIGVDLDEVGAVGIVEYSLIEGGTFLGGSDSGYENLYGVGGERGEVDGRSVGNGQRHGLAWLLRIALRVGPGFVFIGAACQKQTEAEC